MKDNIISFILPNKLLLFLIGFYILLEISIYGMQALTQKIEFSINNLKDTRNEILDDLKAQLGAKEPISSFIHFLTILQILETKKGTLDLILQLEEFLPKFFKVESLQLDVQEKTFDTEGSLSNTDELILTLKYLKEQDKIKVLSNSYSVSQDKIKLQIKGKFIK